MLCLAPQVVKKNREPRWDAEFTWNLEEAPENEHLLLEVHSRGSSMNMVHRQVDSSLV